MFPRRKPTKAPETPTEASTSTASSPQPEQANGHPYDLDAGRIKEMFGFDANDPNVEVKFMTRGEFESGNYRGGNAIFGGPLAGLRSVLDFERRCEDEALGLGKAPSVLDYDNARQGEALGFCDTKAEPPTTPAAVPETGAERFARLEPAIQAIFGEVITEVEKAIRKHRPMASSHEGYSVILEELDELWDEVKADRGYQASGRKEAIQVACTAVRYVLDLDPR